MKRKLAKGTMAAGLSLAFILGVSTFADAKASQYQTGLAGAAAAMEEYTESDSSASQKKAAPSSRKTKTISRTTAAPQKTTQAKHITEVKKQPAATASVQNTTSKQPKTAAKKQIKEPEYTKAMYQGKAVPDVRSVLNIRKKKSTSSPVVGKFKKGNIGTILKKGKEWSKIRSGKVTGYVKNEYLVWGSDIHKYAKEHNLPKKAVVTAETLKVRQKQSTKAKVLTLVSKNDTYKIIKESADWVNVKADGDKGYLAKDYVSIRYYFTNAKSTVKKSKPKAAESTQSTEKSEQSSRETSSLQDSESSSSGTSRQKVVNYALKFVGNKYRYGGNSLTNGIDCSGFTQQVLGHFGYSISRTSSSQANDGRTISISNVRPGDLLFYKRGGRINHVTMYIGNGQVVHASNSAPYPRGGIKVSSIGYRTPCKAVRIIN
ncbi:C40 family peptidase [Anaerostipes sp.]|uniref:C40 family peptidase n=1 Tax=Anaerostipes sp. TaxID=1872530 RepID=UPI0025C6D4FA|nr:SH3 domain-containing C40 family peptidase [Anaerostipes sp.]MBS7007924.1 C40 family peptidase [Anaerostipes sp.]